MKAQTSAEFLVIISVIILLLAIIITPTFDLVNPLSAPKSTQDYWGGTPIKILATGFNQTHIAFTFQENIGAMTNITGISIDGILVFSDEFYIFEEDVFSVFFAFEPEVYETADSYEFDVTINYTNLKTNQTATFVGQRPIVGKVSGGAFGKGVFDGSVYASLIMLFPGGKSLFENWFDRSYSNNVVNCSGLSCAVWNDSQDGYYFNNVNAYTTESPQFLPTGTESRAISYWLQTTGVSVIAVLWGSPVDTQNYFTGFYDAAACDTGSGKKALAGTRGTGNNICSNTTVTTGWHHVVVSYDGTRHFLYLDGVLENKKVITTATTGIDFYIGRDDDNNEALNGHLSNIMVFNDSLNSGQAKALYVYGR
ncbi:MAG: hypothetical protein ACI8Y7_000126 [Candidatus Woesearchaeota archaeon]|jgi:hypothetical protein